MERSNVRRGSSIQHDEDVLEMFSVSSGQREEDDEEALKWAALEKLPTFDRLRKGFLFGPMGSLNEVDVHDLGIQERKDLLERLVKVVEEDNEKFLLKIKKRIDRVGITLPSIEVRFEGLNVETEVHVGTRALPNFKNFYVNIWEGLAARLHIIPSKKKHLTILQDASGILKPGKMTLLLGPPSSGKTTLLLALAGKLDPSLKFSGNVTYNGHTMKDFVQQRTAAYISQHDVHIGEMTVRETLAFSARCQGVGSNIEMMAELLRREKEARINPDPDIDMYMKLSAMEGEEGSILTDYILKILSLDVCADTMVGDQTIRGISGGQRKRLSIGEMLVGPAKVLFMDEISTGLDSSTTFQVVNSIRQSVHILNGTALISLLQPEPETYNLFDEVILISEGQIVYQGPRENAIIFFQSMGFKCPERKGVADFLQQVTSKKDQQQYWVHQDRPYRYITVREFAEAFKSFETGQKLISDLQAPFNENKNHPAALSTEKYGATKMKLVKACAARELMLMKRNSGFYIFRVCRLAVMALIAMTLFFRTQIHRNLNDGYVLVGALYYAIGTIFSTGTAEMPLTIQKLPIFYKQRDLNFYPAWAYGLPAWIFTVPHHIVEIAAYVGITYYGIGYDANVGSFFKQYLVVLAEMQVASALYRFIGAISRDMIIANTWGYFVMLVALSLGGFVLSREDLKSWWLWGYYISPMMYAQTALVVNEFTGHSWSKISPVTNVSLGVDVLRSREFFSQPYWYYIGLGALLAMVLVFNLCYILAITFLDPLRKYQTILSEDRMNIEPEGNNNSCEHKGMVLPFEPYSITFEDIKYSIAMPKAMKDRGAKENRLMLLKGVSGVFRPGVLTALMGVTGAGKTTLMDVLAGRKNTGYIEGKITVSGYPKKQETFTHISGYCEQYDIHSPNITIYESLLFSAWLRLPPEVDSNTRKLFVEEVMELVELTPLRGALVGIPSVSGLSAEQRKRLTIAVELVSNPSIVFMDEPTSGLDARAARAIRTLFLPLNPIL